MKLSFIDVTSALTSDGYGGASVVIKNIVPRLTRYFEVDYIPSLRSIISMGGEDQKARLLSTLDSVKEYGLNVPDAVLKFLEDMSPWENPKRRIELYLSATTKPAERPDYYFDADYWFYNLSPPLLRPLIFSPPHYDLLLGDVYALARRSGRKAIVLLQGVGTRYSSFPGHIPLQYLRSAGMEGANVKDLLKWEGYEIAHYVYSRALKGQIFKGVLGMSKGALANAGLADCEKCKALRVGAAFDAELLGLRNASKDNYALFFGRLVTNKGVLELPRIYKRMRNATQADMVIAGKFFDRQTEKAFNQQLKKLDVKDGIKLTGWLPIRDLYETIARAKVLLYPSHSDSFSLVILQSLAAGTPVVAYDIPGPRSVFSGLPAVKFVKEFDWKAMADEAVKIMRMRDEDYYNMINDEEVMKFLKDHSSWDDAAEEVANIIMELAERRYGTEA